MTGMDVVTVAERFRQRFSERAAALDPEAAFPAEDVADLADAGMLGLLVPVDLGGMGAGFADYVRVAMELARGSGSTALVFNMHAAVTGALAGIPEEAARALGVSDDALQRRNDVLASAARGALYGVAITEKEAGSRLSQLQTTYTSEDGAYRLVGDKSVCTGAGHLDGYLVAARAAGSTDDEPRISYFLVPPGEGVTPTGTWDPLGMRATASIGLRLDTRVDAGALIGGIEGLALLLAYAMPQWLVASYAAVYVGVAQAALDEAIAYVQRRSVAGRQGGLADVGFIRGRLGRADAQVEAARQVLLDAGRLVDSAPGQPSTNRQVYRAKLLAGDAAMEVAASCAEACGLGALGRGSMMERLFRDARSGALMPPSSDVCADVLATAALGLDPVTGSQVRPW